MRCDITDGVVSASLSEGGLLKSAEVVLNAPKGVRLNSRQAAIAFATSRGLRQPLVTRLKQSKSGAWEADAGRYSALVHEWYPPCD